MPETQTQGPETGDRQSARILNLKLYEPGHGSPDGGTDQDSAATDESAPHPADGDAARRQAEARQLVDTAMANSAVVQGGERIMANPGQFVADDAAHERLATDDELAAARALPRQQPAGQHVGGQESLGRSIVGRLRGLLRRSKH